MKVALIEVTFRNAFANMFSGGERGIRTLDTLPHTRFPSVLLKPLGHLTVFGIPLV